MRTLIAIVISTMIIAKADADPQLTSWFTVNSGKIARIYRTDAERISGQAETTWSNGHQSQSQPAYSGVQEILSSSNWIYIRSTGLAGHVMGPWFDDPQHRRQFPNLPTDQHYIYAIPRHPKASVPGASYRLNEIGMSVDGVRIFDANDAFSYSHASGKDAGPREQIGRGDQIWNRDAYVNEGKTFDPAMAHQPEFGAYHYHAEPLALRYLLGDHVDYESATGAYHESTSNPTKHSPILGWMQDGYPIYGPYGFSNATNPASGVRRMVCGFVARDGHDGSDNLAQTGRKTLPAWEAREQNRQATLATNETGPDVSQRYPIGHYIEDYAYLGDLGKKIGNDFDLDELNGRWCVTPEYPQGTYAYFTAIDAKGKPEYPYNMGRQYHGKPIGCLMRSINEPVATNFVAHAETMASVKPGAAPAGTTTLQYNGSSYKQP